MMVAAGQEIMRVAIVTYSLNVGGMESLLLSLATGLRELGASVDFVLTEGDGVWAEEARRHGFPVWTITQRRLESKVGHARRVSAHLCIYDAVLLNHSLVAQASAGLLPDNTAVISVLHSDNDEIYRIGLANVGELDGVVAVSPRVLDVAGQRLGTSLEFGRFDKLHLILSGTKVEDEWPKRDCQTDSRIRVAFVGRMVDGHKGVLDIPKIAMLTRLSGFDISFDIVGDGPDLAVLMEKMSACAPQVEATFYGALAHREAMAILSDADCLLMPSRFEGFPIILLEALARGVIPVASLLPGITDRAITDGVDGFLCKVGDHKSFSRALCDLADPRRRSDFSKAAWRTAKTKFDEREMVRAYLQVLHNAVEMRRFGCRLGCRSGKLDGGLLGRLRHVPRCILWLRNVHGPARWSAQRLFEARRKLASLVGYGT